MRAGLLFKVLILLLFGSANSYAEKKHDMLMENVYPGPTEYFEQPFDVLEYDVEMDLTNDNPLLTEAKCRIKAYITGDKDTSSFYFNLRGLTVDSVFYHGVKVEISEIGTVDSADYHFEFPLSIENIPAENIADEDTADILIYYSGSMTGENNAAKWGGVWYGSGILYSLGVGFYNNYVSTTQHWLPCFDHPSDKAKFHGRFIVNEGMNVASVGEVEVEEPGDGTVIYDWTHDYDCATYLYTFAMSEFRELNFGDEDLPMVVYTLPRDTAHSAYAYKLLPKMVEAYEERFGVYPFEKVGYVNTPKGSMEHETMISMAVSLIRSAISSKDSMNYTAAHELSHQWFGDLVSPLDYRDAWLNEGFAVFCEAIWEEYMFGHDAYLDYQSSKINSYIKSIVKSDGVIPLYDFPRTPSNYPGTIYYKGGVVVGMLRYELGDSLFFEAMREYLSENAYGNVTTEILKNKLEEKAGKNLDDFFNQWVIGSGWPVLDINVGLTGSDTEGLINVEMNIAQVQDEEYGVFTGLPVEIGFETSEGDVHYELLIMDEKEQSFSLSDISDFTNITVNQGPTVRALIELNSLNGVEEQPQISFNAVKIFPNPAKEKITVRFDAAFGEAEISIINSTGKIVYDSLFTTYEGLNSAEISTDMLASGNYKLIIKQGELISSASVSIIK